MGSYAHTLHHPSNILDVKDYYSVLQNHRD